MHSASDSSMPETALPPWLAPAWQRLMSKPDSLHHALLLRGPAGTGKLTFAETLARALLSTHTDPACRCADCLRFGAGSHPDFHVLTAANQLQINPERPANRHAVRYVPDQPRTASGGQWITIAQVRALHEQFASTPPQLARCRVALIAPADALNQSAANALLKLLEEPPNNSFLLLVSARRDALPATIRSRCFELPLHLPPRAEALDWLKQQGAADAGQWLDLGLGPLAALQLQAAGGPGWTHSVTALSECLSGKLPAPELAERLSTMDFALLLRCLQRQVLDLLTWQLTGQPPEWFGALRPRAHLAPDKAFSVYDKILFYTRLLGQPVNQRLAVDALCLALAGALVPIGQPARN